MMLMADLQGWLDRGIVLDAYAKSKLGSLPVAAV